MPRSRVGRREAVRTIRITTVTAMLLVPALLSGGCGRGSQARGREYLDHGHAAFLAARYQQATVLYAHAVRNLPRGSERREARYWHAASLLPGRARAAGQEARELFRDTHDPDLKARCLLLQARALAARRHWGRALAIYRRLRRDLPGHFDEDAVRAAMAEAASRCGRDRGRARRPAAEARTAPRTHLRPGLGGPGTEAPYVVQVGAFSSRARANALRDRVRAAGYECAVVGKTRAGKRLHLVQAGAFTSRARARTRAAALRSRGFPAVVHWAH